MESRINRLLFNLSVENDVKILVGRDTRWLREYYSDYSDSSITMCNESTLSIKYYGYVYSVFRTHEFCYGITINTETGAMGQIEDYIYVDEELINKLLDNNLQYHSPPMYGKDFVVSAVTDFGNQQERVRHG